MKLLQKFFAILLALSLLVSCAPTNLEILSAKENALKSGGDYSSYLALEYLQFSRSLKSTGSLLDSEYFAKKGLYAASRRKIFPENPIKWKADPQQLEELIAIQKRMELVITRQIESQLPIQTAHLFYLYDCWASKESKPIFRASELSKCKSRFSKLLDEIEYYLDDLKKDRQPKTVIVEPEFRRFEILFDLNSYKFNDRANRDLLTVLKYLKTLNGDYRILLVGNADRVGSDLYNQGLALERVEIVKNYMTKNGVSADFIETRSVGEDFPDIITREGLQKQSNRTVGIYILRGAKSFAAFPLPLIENYVYREGVENARKERGLE